MRNKGEDEVQIIREVVEYLSMRVTPVELEVTADTQRDINRAYPNSGKGDKHGFACGPWLLGLVVRVNDQLLPGEFRLKVSGSR